jgi:hypothetical protein
LTIKIGVDLESGIVDVTEGKVTRSTRFRKFGRVVWVEIKRPSPFSLQDLAALKEAIEAHLGEGAEVRFVEEKEATS